MALVELSPAQPLTGEAADRRASGAWATGAVTLAVVWWAAGLVMRTGGRDPHVLTVGLLLVGIAWVFVRPWRHLPRSATGFAVSVGLGAWSVVLLAPTGWAGANEAASYVHATLLGVLLLAWAQTAERRQALVVALVLGACVSFAGGWLAWWGGGNASAPFIGTFYWHNQEGALLATGAVAACGLLGSPDRVVRLLARVAAPLCGAGVALTTSRASLGALGIGMLAVIALVKGLRARVRVVVAALGMVAVSFALTGPPFFSSRVAPLAGTQVRSAHGETLATNGGHRLDDWVAASRVFAHWPVTGSGFHGLRDASRRVSPEHIGASTPFAHNGYLQVLSDGGLLLGVPFLALVGCVLIMTWRRMRHGELSPAAVGAFAAGFVLLLHSGVDFDWSYPALLAAPCLLLPTLLPPAPATRRLPVALGVLLPLGLLTVSSVGAWHGGMTLNAPLGGHL